MRAGQYLRGPATIPLYPHIPISNRGGINGNYAICSICGKEYTRPNIQVSKYCSDCSKEIRKKKVAENMKAYRKKKALNEKKAIND